jgi:hypothetical protein
MLCGSVHEKYTRWFRYDWDCLHTNQSRSCLNHLVSSAFQCSFFLPWHYYYYDYHHHHMFVIPSLYSLPQHRCLFICICRWKICILSATFFPLQFPDTSSHPDVLQSFLFSFLSFPHILIFSSTWLNFGLCYCVCLAHLKCNLFPTLVNRFWMPSKISYLPHQLTWTKYSLRHFLQE